MISSLPDENLEGGIALANELEWNISTEERSNKWLVCGGDQLIFRSDNIDSFNAFLYGLALKVL